MTTKHYANGCSPKYCHAEASNGGRCMEFCERAPTTQTEELATPRTDYAATLVQYAVVGEQYKVVTAAFARQLERELSQAAERLRTMEEQVRNAAESEKEAIEAFTLAAEQTAQAKKGEGDAWLCQHGWQERAESAERSNAALREALAEQANLLDAVAGSLWECWIEECGGKHLCACCQREIDIAQWTTAEHEAGCPVLIAKGRWHDLGMAEVAKKQAAAQPQDYDEGTQAGLQAIAGGGEPQGVSEK